MPSMVRYETWRSLKRIAQGYRAYTILALEHFLIQCKPLYGDTLSHELQKLETRLSQYSSLIKEQVSCLPYDNPDLNNEDVKSLNAVVFAISTWVTRNIPPVVTHFVPQTNSSQPVADEVSDRKLENILARVARARSTGTLRTDWWDIKICLSDL
jgi:hypothetical protein